MRTILSQCSDTAVCRVIVVYVLLLHSGVEKKYLLCRIKSKVCEPTSKLSPEILVFQTVNGMIGGVGIWKWAHWKQLGEKRNLKKWAYMCPLTAYTLNLNQAVSARGGSSGGGICALLQHLLPPSLPSLSPSLLSSPEGFLALKHCIRAPPTGQRNFTATDKYKPRLFMATIHSNPVPWISTKGSNKCTKPNIIQMCCISQAACCLIDLSCEQH